MRGWSISIFTRRTGGNGASAAPLRWCAVVSVLILSLLTSPSFAIYCDEDDYYHPLGVSQNANASEIKKAYCKLSLKYHPDKNPDSESRKLFVKIANAYEILKDVATREHYDYAIAHPEEDPRAVLVGLLLVLSAFQYLNSWTRYNQAVMMIKKTPVHKNRLWTLELERSGGTTKKKKKKSNRQMDKKIKEDLSKELELDIKGAEKPCIWKLIGVRFALLPYTLGKMYLGPGTRHATRRMFMLNGQVLTAKVQRYAVPDSWHSVCISKILHVV